MSTSATGPRTGAVDAMLDRARSALRRLSPQQAQLAVSRGALLVDIRTPWQREMQGELPGAIVIDRTVLEWRLDPSSDARIPEAVGYDIKVIVVCRQGYSSSLAAASLQSLGLGRATDVVGGVEAWLAAGLPTGPGPADGAGGAGRNPLRSCHDVSRPAQRTHRGDPRGRASRAASPGAARRQRAARRTGAHHGPVPVHGTRGDRRHRARHPGRAVRVDTGVRLPARHTDCSRTRSLPTTSYLT